MRIFSKEQIINKLKQLNFHWEFNRIPNDIHKMTVRKYFGHFIQLVELKDVRRAIILMGPRRVGKTILLQQTIQHFIDEGRNPKSLVYIPLDAPYFYHLSLEELLSHYLEEVKDIEEEKLVIFDEIQYVKNWDSQLKYLVDIYKGIKFIGSGSAASALNRKSMESGAGRFTDFMLPPLTFYEYLHLTDSVENCLNCKDDGYAEKIHDIIKLNNEFINYLNYGCFPEAVFNPVVRNDKERHIRQDIMDRVLLRDLPSLYGITDIQELNNFFYYLTYQTGREVTYEKLSTQSGVSKEHLKKYIEYLESAFLIRTIRRVDEKSNRFQKLTRFKVYLTNPSMYAALWGDLIDNEDSDILGHIVETAIFSQFTHDSHWLGRLYYAVFSQNRGEVDMVHLGKDLKPNWCVEVKWSDRSKDHFSELKNIRKFCSINTLNKAFITTKTINKIEMIDNKTIEINYIPAALLCYNLGQKMIHQYSISDPSA